MNEFFFGNDVRFRSIANIMLAEKLFPLMLAISSKIIVKHLIRELSIALTTSLFILFFLAKFSSVNLEIVWMESRANEGSSNSTVLLNNLQSLLPNFS